MSGQVVIDASTVYYNHWKKHRKCLPGKITRAHIAMYIKDMRKKLLLSNPQQGASMRTIFGMTFSPTAVLTDDNLDGFVCRRTRPDGTVVYTDQCLQPPHRVRPTDPTPILVKHREEKKKPYTHKRPAITSTQYEQLLQRVRSTGGVK